MFPLSNHDSHVTNMTNTHSTSASYPQYIVRGGDTAFAPPYILNNTKLYGFFLVGTLGNLQKLCDNYLNIPGQDQFQYRPYMTHSRREAHSYYPQSWLCKGSPLLA